VLSCNPLAPAYRPDVGAGTGPASAHAPATAATAAAPSAWVDHPGGLVDIGHAGGGFAFDNESPRHTVLLRPFRLATRPVTNGEWLEFMADGGYARPELWLSDGWATVLAEQWDAPLYWRHRDGADHEWDEFTLTGQRVLDPAQPVCHVSYYEADAFARWRGARLATETEWEAVAAEHTVESGRRGLDALHPQPARDATGPLQLLGEAWEWTASPYVAYPGFRPAAGAVGEYNGKFMVNQHVLRGGCCLTPPGHVRVTYRNFFPPSARWACSGVRLAADD
jgi:ergothioneine biosynthesis protein EgtB